MIQSSKNGIGRPSKYPKLINGLKKYIVEAHSNPAMKLTILAISHTIGVKKSTIYLYQQHDPEVAELLNSIRVLAAARKLDALDKDELLDSEREDACITSQGTRLDVADNVIEPIALDLLTERSATVVQRAVWSMSRFIGHHRKHRYLSDLPRVVFDLDSTLAQLHRIREDLSNLSDEWMQISQTNCEIANAGEQLSLSLIDEGQF
jgi:hypothetical protein